MARKKFVKKPKLDTENINERIRALEVRLVGENLGDTEGGVMFTRKALAIAEDLGLDLVEISPKANPPVVKIVDYSKFIYEKKRALKNNVKTKSVLKEIRLSPFIGDADYHRKVKQAREFLERGDKVKLTAQVGGRNFNDLVDKVTTLALKLVLELDDISDVETIPKFSGRRMVSILKPSKKK